MVKSERSGLTPCLPNVFINDLHPSKQNINKATFTSQNLPYQHLNHSLFPFFNFAKLNTINIVYSRHSTITKLQNLRPTKAHTYHSGHSSFLPDLPISPIEKRIAGEDGNFLKLVKRVQTRTKATLFPY